MNLSPPAAASPDKAAVILSRAQRAHYRLSWQERLTRNARVSTSGQVTIRRFGVPESFATSLGLATASHHLDNWWVPSSRRSLLLRVEPHGLSSWLFLNSCSLPPFFLSVLLFLSSLAGQASGFEQLSLL
ncbi:MAG TPA: hypothetical protein VGN34_17295 [Ktedonobacteraceae bacterium]